MKTFYTTLIFALVTVAANAATVSISWSITTGVYRLEDRTLSPLSNGTATAGDGTLIQLGYYSLASLANPFAGSWVTLASTTMGDDGIELPGKFGTTTILGGTPFPAPAVGTPLAVRFFDGTSEASSSYFNAVANTAGAWNFVAPNDPAPTITIVIDKDPNIKFQSVGGAFSTQIAVPEPSALILASVALSFSLLTRRRQKN
jgi:hypothetical protein